MRSGDEVDAVAEEPVAEPEPEDGDDARPSTPKKKTRRGTRGGRNRKRKPAGAAVNGDAPERGCEEPERRTTPSSGRGGAPSRGDEARDGGQAKAEAAGRAGPRRLASTSRRTRSARSGEPSR